MKPLDARMQVVFSGSGWYVPLSQGTCSLEPCPRSISRGVLESVVPPSPTCPNSFAPQHFRLASSKITQVCLCPTETDVALVLRMMTSGVGCATSVPSPSCPWLLSPQQATSPESNRPQLWKRPTSISIRSRSELNAEGSGLLESEVPPLPSCPWAL